MFKHLLNTRSFLSFSFVITSNFHCGKHGHESKDISSLSFHDDICILLYKAFSKKYLVELSYNELNLQ